MSASRSDEPGRRHWQTPLLGALAVGMFGFGFALVPLYGLLCEVTGMQQGGLAAVARPGEAVAATGTASKAARSDRVVVVKFDGTVHPDLPWGIVPETRQMQVRPGETYEVNFRATNHSSAIVSGQAIPAVAPWQANGFFNKLECFCFREQTLAGNEQVEMPLRFVVSPDLPANINSLTLSYSFLRLGP